MKITKIKIRKRKLRLHLYTIIWNVIIKQAYNNVKRSRIQKNVLELLVRKIIKLQLKLQNKHDQHKHK